jgi:hypothetical protein
LSSPEINKKLKELGSKSWVGVPSHAGTDDGFGRWKRTAKKRKGEALRWMIPTFISILRLLRFSENGLRSTMNVLAPPLAPDRI